MDKTFDSHQALRSGRNLKGRETEILKEVTKETGFKPVKKLSQSSFWDNQQIGAFHWLGDFKSKQAVLKIEGIPVELKEPEIIAKFAQQNQSQIIRPPHIYFFKPWDSQKKYETVIMEYVRGDKVLQSGKLQSRENIEKFFEIYQEYRQNCLPSKPWIEKTSINIMENFEKAWEVYNQQFPNYPFRKDEDHELTKKASQILAKFYQDVDLEFIHGHFSVEDLVRKDSEVVLFSNLFWKWKYPFYDAVFGYHWFMYTLSHVKNITSDQVDEQRKYWFETMQTLVKNNQDQRLLTVTLLERAIAGLIIDGCLADPTNPITSYLFESTREQIKQLSSQLSKA